MTMDQAKKITKAYYSLRHPSKFVSYFKSMQEFNQWCEEGTKEDLQYTLKAFEAEELYEHCVIINEVIKSKWNE